MGKFACLGAVFSRVFDYLPEFCSNRQKLWYCHLEILQSDNSVILIVLFSWSVNNNIFNLSADRKKNISWKMKKLFRTKWRRFHDAEETLIARSFLKFNILEKWCFLCNVISRFVWVKYNAESFNGFRNWQMQICKFLLVRNLERLHDLSF